MVRCPECRRDFYDDSLIFCLDDGARLLDGPVSLNEATSVLLRPIAASDQASTRVQIDITNLPSTDSTSKKFYGRLPGVPS